jgi:hypothetical protein
MRNAGNNISEQLISSKLIKPDKEYQDWILQNYSKSQNLSINESKVCILIILYINYILINNNCYIYLLLTGSRFIL